MFGTVFLTLVTFVSVLLADGNELAIIFYSLVVYIYLCLVLDPALVGLSLAYVGTMTVILQFVVRVSADLENLVSTCIPYLLIV